MEDRDRRLPREDTYAISGLVEKGLLEITVSKLKAMDKTSDEGWRPLDTTYYSKNVHVEGTPPADGGFEAELAGGHALGIHSVKGLATRADYGVKGDTRATGVEQNCSGEDSRRDRGIQMDQNPDMVTGGMGKCMA